MPMWRDLDYQFLKSIGEKPDPEYTEIVNKLTLERESLILKEDFNFQ